ncbi:ribosomal protein S18 acetylase RimI-like enzyme [Chitinophaga niastensis]|uniref:Ribosomal protein S18 acetylase RimI-like enzyme n=1 Tax=Chitinophaga niastensis TaxID=536980 RepID=A0A2P8HNZ6_CHINA|nr:GNAT family N-acetyltransferase [Chitinophaga niastensis]PSL47936.1 ribosomal protein S18 acetylase RimI-like enzyme [Chitinophaga niastensis]
MPSVQTALDDKSLLACSEVILFLRPHLQQQQLLQQIKEMQQEDYRIVYITADEDPSKVVAFAGYRHMQKLFSGKTIYIDDLACLPDYQGRGYAASLLNHIKALAKTEGLSSVQLDSGHALFPAHRLYHRQGFRISAHHFTQPL